MEGLNLATQGLASGGAFAIGLLVLAVLAGAIRVARLSIGQKRAANALPAEEPMARRAA